jgi:hypothetical protein
MCVRYVVSLKDAHAAEGRCASIEIYGTDEHGCRVANVDEAESSRRASRPKYWLWCKATWYTRLPAPLIHGFHPETDTNKAIGLQVAASALSRPRNSCGDLT